MSTENDTKSTTSTFMHTLIILAIYSIIFVLLFIFIYDPTGSIGNIFAILFGALAIGYIVTILYYRMTVGGVDKSEMKTILLTNAASYMVLFVTMVSISINPKLVTIFENTIGIWYLSIMGNDSFVNEIFQSEIFSKMDDESINDSELVNYGFLLTRLNQNNIDEFVEFYKNNTNNNNTSNVDFPLDFKPNFKNDNNAVKNGQLIKLKELVNTKRTVGYFMWVYLTAIISQMISMIAVTMKI